MVEKGSSGSMFHTLPPLPDFDDEPVAKPKHQQNVPKQKSLDTLSVELENELHKSDVYRHEEVDTLKKSTSVKKHTKSHSKKKTHKAKEEPIHMSKVSARTILKRPTKKKPHLKKDVLEKVIAQMPPIPSLDKLDDDDTKSVKNAKRLPPVVEKTSYKELASMVDSEIHGHKAQFEAVDSDFHFPKEKIPDVPRLGDAPNEAEISVAELKLDTKRKELDLLQKRQQDYFDALRARMDHETRERQEHVKQKAMQIGMKESELLKWEQTLLKREKHIAATTTEHKKIKALQAQLEDSLISVKFEKARMHELEQQLKEKDAKLRAYEKQLEQKESELQSIKEKLEHEGAIVPVHSGAHLAHFDAQQKELSDKFDAAMRESFVKPKPQEAPKQKEQVKSHFDRPISLTKSIELDKLRLAVLRCYEYIGGNDLKAASAGYTALANAYRNYASEFGNDVMIHAEIKQLYHDLALQLRG